MPVVVGGRGPADVPRIQAAALAAYKVSGKVSIAGPGRAVSPPADQSGYCNPSASTRSGVGAQGLVRARGVLPAFVCLLDMDRDVAESGQPARVRLLRQATGRPLLVITSGPQHLRLVVPASPVLAMAQQAPISPARAFEALQCEGLSDATLVFGRLRQ